MGSDWHVEEFDKIRVIRDQSREDTVISDFSFAEPRDGHGIRFENVHLTRCTTVPGTCLLLGNVSLENVSFVDFDCGDAIRIKVTGRIERVVIAGRKPRALIVKSPGASVADDGLDIEAFQGEVDIAGIPVSSVRRSAQKHVGLIVPAEEAWARLGISPTSYWRTMAHRIADEGAMEGVISLPRSRGKRYERHMEELVKLVGAGVCHWGG